MHRRTFKKIMPIFLLFLFAVMVFFIVKPFISSLAFASIIVYLFYPVYVLLYKKIKSESLSSILTCLVIIIIIVIPLFYILKSLIIESPKVIFSLIN